MESLKKSSNANQITIFERMVLLFLIGLMATAVLQRNRESSKIQTTIETMARELQICLRSVEESYIEGSTSGISDSVSHCKNVKSDHFNIFNVNVNGVVKMIFLKEPLKNQNLTLVPILANDIAEISGDMKQKITKWRCDVDSSMREKGFYQRLCGRLNGED